MSATVPALEGPFGATLLPLLRALGNQRGEAVVISGIFETGRPLDMDALAATLERLGHDVSQGERARARWREPLDGGLVAVTGSGEVRALIKRAGQIFAVPGLEPLAPEAAAAIAASSRLLHVRAMYDLPLTEFDEDVRHVVAGGYAISLAANLVALCVPFLIMVVYDRVIGGAAPEILPGLATGGALVLIALLLLRVARGRLLAAAHARFGDALQARVARRLARAPLAVAGRFQPHGALARLAEAWRPVDPLSHALSTAVFDAPFVLLGLLAVALIGGWIVLVPLLYLPLLAGLALLLARRTRLGLQVAGEVATEREAMLAELADKAVALREAGLAEGWLARFGAVQRRMAGVAMQAATRAAFTQALGHVFGSGLALATLALGVALVLEGAMTAGGLIASMLLIWRINAPVQALFFSLARLRQVPAQRARLEAVLKLPTEADQPARLHHAGTTPVELRFDRVSYTHPGAGSPALLGLTLRIAPGEVVAVTGPTGSGKSTLLQLAAGLMAPQSGAVLLGGENLAHVDPDELRLRAIAHVPRAPHAFRLGAEDNLRLAAPWRREVTVAVAGGDLGLARARLKDAWMTLVDTPLRGAEDPGRPAFEAFLAAERGRRTVIFATADPALAALADRVVVLDRGQAVYAGPPRPALALGASDA
ncbi:ATP-binding cassette domain-containing protein [Sediminicoccus rosea]|uniref:ATP-binding cassette domain-containing protein n=1 Tax=Sediminicoccus rosea TaxID=1225128 RepID=A0ABZ0PKR4_9PROT|nr:ATP-binding cassette domain-containing protein [Sediminicoccus rosea]WPB86036.1 ATP-binding cassette domain-containing protein [Sediminicoccus rosea]